MNAALGRLGSAAITAALTATAVNILLADTVAANCTDRWGELLLTIEISNLFTFGLPIAIPAIIGAFAGCVLRRKAVVTSVVLLVAAFAYTLAAFYHPHALSDCRFDI